MAFETTSEATKLWIKGREFTVARLLGDAYKDQAERYVGGALVIFRLAPQDYHRFHSPVDGTIGPMTYISGEYYTVNVSINVLFDYLFVVCSCAIGVPLCV
jgi:phosphatidylserine decarboxylase